MCIDCRRIVECKRERSFNYFFSWRPEHWSIAEKYVPVFYSGMWTGRGVAANDRWCCLLIEDHISPCFTWHYQLDSQTHRTLTSVGKGQNLRCLFLQRRACWLSFYSVYFSCPCLSLPDSTVLETIFCWNSLLSFEGLLLWLMSDIMIQK